MESLKTGSIRGRCGLTRVSYCMEVSQRMQEHETREPILRNLYTGCLRVEASINYLMLGWQGGVQFWASSHHPAVPRCWVLHRHCVRIELYNHVCYRTFTPSNQFGWLEICCMSCMSSCIWNTSVSSDGLFNLCSSFIRATARVRRVDSIETRGDRYTPNPMHSPVSYAPLSQSIPQSIRWSIPRSFWRLIF